MFITKEWNKTPINEVNDSNFRKFYQEENYESPQNIIETGSDVQAIKNMHDFITATSHTPMILCKRKCIEFLCRISFFREINLIFC